jgi:hypothetical protein
MIGSVQVIPVPLIVGGAISAHTAPTPRARSGCSYERAGLPGQDIIHQHSSSIIVESFVSSSGTGSLHSEGTLP